MSDSLIDKLASDFDKAWPDCSIEVCLEQVENSLKPALLEELVRVEVDRLRKESREPSWDDYRRRFAEFTDVIRTLEASLTPTRDLPHRFSDQSAREDESAGSAVSELLEEERAVRSYLSMARQQLAIFLRKQDEQPERFMQDQIELFEDYVRKYEQKLKTIRRKLRELGSGNFSSHDPQAPLRFSDYLLEEELGRGGMGIVFRAQQKSLPRLVAVKTLLNQNAESKKRFRREACTVASLGSHPNIVPVHGFGTIPQGKYDFGHIREDTYFLAMEFINGSDLAKLIRPGGITVDWAVQIVVAIADAIEHAHKHGIWHRDLKPTNVLIDEAGRVLVTDFGLAKVDGGPADFQSLPGQVVGTPNYMPPEQADRKRGEVGPWSDVYGLGGILYELLVGKPPYTGDTTWACIANVLSDIYPASPRVLRPDVPAPIDAICMKCLSKRPEDRYVSALAVKEAIQSLSPSPPAGTPPIATNDDEEAYEIEGKVIDGNDIYCSELAEQLEARLLTKVVLRFTYDLKRETMEGDRWFSPTTEAKFRFKLASTPKNHGWEELQKLALRPGVGRNAKFVGIGEDIRSAWMSFTLLHCASAVLRVYDIIWELAGRPRQAQIAGDKSTVNQQQDKKRRDVTHQEHETLEHGPIDGATRKQGKPAHLLEDIDDRVASAEHFESIGDAWSAAKRYEDLAEHLTHQGNESMAQEMLRRAKLNRRAAASLMRGDSMSTEEGGNLAQSAQAGSLHNRRAACLGCGTVVILTDHVLALEGINPDDLSVGQVIPLQLGCKQCGGVIAVYRLE